MKGLRVFYLVTNQDKDPGGLWTERLRAHIAGRGGICHTAPMSAGRGGKNRYTDERDVPQDTECVLVLGGDGTLLKAARDLISRPLPLMGINMGTLGYLAEIEVSGAMEAIDRLMEGRYEIGGRMLLQGTAFRQNTALLSDLAVNDIAIVRRGHLRVIDFNIYVDDSFLCAYRADGIILSTPTGSTGYSLSAGGPIVSPSASLILLTAIAPHTLNSRPVILPDDVKVTVEIAYRPGHADSDGAEVTFDGDTTLNVGEGDRICITSASRRVRLIKLNDTSFVEILRKKMN